ncbi:MULTISPECIES: HlyD family type I secretion periplasmic adaptor subunit [unclassified Bradyrhizobium]|uniref:HlyD family type I secretion periplasmic adaptor subunit n=1 Tax=unclassified Bradyrhizobium TaxID=2631580 RepID=UPI0032E3AF8A
MTFRRTRPPQPPATTDLPPWHASLPRSTRLPTIGGIVIMAATVMGFGVWGNTAPIAGAVVASGVFVATGQNKTIQHLEGGVIKEIMVHEGDIVEPGQTLLELDPTTAQAELRRLFLRSTRLTAMDVRLQAEVREDEAIRFPMELTIAAEDPEVKAIIGTQVLTFTARRNNLKSDIASIDEGIKALNERIAGSRIQLDGVQRQIKFVEEEVGEKEYLLRSGLVRKPEVLLLQRTQANLEGEVGRIMGDIGDAKERIARSQEQINGVRKTAIKTAVEQLHEVRGELADVNERMLTARGVLGRTTITAPVKGVVVKLRYHTQGGVVEPGKPIMELLPLQEELVIEARVRPQDIDSVKHGQHAMVRLTALSQRVTPMISGDVVYLSADTLADERKSMQVGPTDIYLVRVRLNKTEASAISGFSPTPGMPAEVYIKTAERTFFQYITKPIHDSIARAFRER